jgi:hypothetical protein
LVLVTVYDFQGGGFFMCIYASLCVLQHVLYDVVPYRPSNSPLENHHGVLDVWAKHNIPNYVSRGADTPTIALTKEQHDATKRHTENGYMRKQVKNLGKSRLEIGFTSRSATINRKNV